MEEPLAPSPCPYGCAAQLAVGPLPLLAFAGTRCFLYNNRLPRPSSQPCPPSDKTNKQTRRPKLLFSFLFLNYWRPERILIVLFLDRIIFLFIRVTLFFFERVVGVLCLGRNGSLMAQLAC